MLRRVTRQCRPLLSAGKSSQSFLNRTTATTSFATPQYRSEATDLSMSVQFTIPSNKFKEFLQRAREVGGKLEKQTTQIEVYYDSVPESEELTELDVVPANFDLKTKTVDPEKGRAKIHPKVGKPKLNHAGLYTLTKRDMWLVKQDGVKWVLRMPTEDEHGRTHLDLDTNNRIPVFRIAEGERAIRRELSLQQDETTAAITGVPLTSLEEDLEARMGVVPYASFVNTQYVFKIQKDEAERIAQIEPEEPDEKEDETIRKFAKAKGDHFVNVSDGVYEESLGETLELEVNKTNFGYSMGKLTVEIENPDEISTVEMMHYLTTTLDQLDIKLVEYANTPILEYLERNRTNTHHKLLIGASVAVNHAKIKARAGSKDGEEGSKSDDEEEKK